MKTVKAIGFVVAAMGAGVLSGCNDPWGYGVRGAVLGGVLAAGVIVCERWRQRKGALPLGVTLSVAVAAALAVTLILEPRRFVMTVNNGLENRHPFVSPETAWVFLTCLLIACGLLLCHRSYSLRQRWFVRGLLFWGVSALSLFPRAALFGETIVSLFTNSFMRVCYVGGLFAFLLLWGLVAWAFGFFRTPGGGSTSRPTNP